MKTTTSASVALALLLWAAPALADTPPKLEPIPEPGPAVSADDDAPEITIRNRGKDKIEEYRLHGQLYMIKVTPRVGKPYYLIDNQGNGRFVRSDGLDKGLVVPTWILKSW